MCFFLFKNTNYYTKYQNRPHNWKKKKFLNFVDFCFCFYWVNYSACFGECCSRKFFLLSLVCLFMCLFCSSRASSILQRIKTVIKLEERRRKLCRFLLCDSAIVWSVFLCLALKLHKQTNKQVYFFVVCLIRCI